MITITVIIIIITDVHIFWHLLLLCKQSSGSSGWFVPFAPASASCSELTAA
jgi:hypothetical protein